MRTLLLLIITTLTLTSCGSNYKIEELYGKWQGPSLGFTFNEDGSCEIIMGGEKWPGETAFRAVSIGNTLEFTANGKVILSNVTIKSLVGDVLTIEMRPMISSAAQTTQVHELKRVK